MDNIAHELVIHSTLEEEIFYPAVKNARGGQTLVNEAESEHKKLDLLVAEAQGMSMESDEVVWTVGHLRDVVDRHTTKEENKMFRVAEDGLSEKLRELGERIAARKKELAGSRVQKAKRAFKKALRMVA